MQPNYASAGGQGLQKRVNAGGAWRAIEICYLHFDKLSASQKSFIESVATRRDAKMTLAEVRTLARCLETAWGGRTPSAA